MRAMPFLRATFWLKRLLLLAALSPLTACMVMPAGSGFNAPQSGAVSVNRTTWLGSVRITDENIRADDRQILEESLRGNISDYIAGSGIFAALNTPPGRPATDDLVLDFEYSRYQQKRSPHPAYFPAAILTLTMYIWAGGPIFKDSTNLTETLTVKDGAGTVLGAFAGSRQSLSNVGLWDKEYVLPSGIDARTSLMEELLEKAKQNIK